MRNGYNSRIVLTVIVLGLLALTVWWIRGISHPPAQELAVPHDTISTPAVATTATEASATTPSGLPGPVVGSGELAVPTPAASQTREAAPTATPAPNTPVPASAVTAAEPASRQPLDPAVARFADTSIPVETRMAEVEQLGKSGDANAAQTLMKLGDAYTYLNFKAIEALGNVKSPEVAKYLEGKLGDKDPKVSAQAMESLARVQGEAAVAAIAATIAANRQRVDGFQDTVCAAGVKALGAIGSATAIPALADEFEKTVGKTLQHEYGSQVVAAMRVIGDGSAAPALSAYVARLEKEHAAMADNVMGQRYLEGKIKEVKDALEALAQKGVTK